MKEFTKAIASSNFTEVSSTSSSVEKFSDNNHNFASQTVSAKTANSLSTSEISFLKVLIGLNIQRV